MDQDWGLNNIELNVLPVYDNRYIKTKIRVSDNKVYPNFWGWKVREDDIKYDIFTIISTDSSLAYKNKYYLQVYLDSCAL